ncbi:hypothetical protein MLD38_035183 [Melastoma candidum]|uniref:Uncharacterized protein n=1 Tax=Melastoma candidum TaxID=119954 RepID=A0ACB9MDY7_9MYRT|nr:hypothetical protein MLD38_035183 [Melastoma candidum]
MALPPRRVDNLPSNPWENLPIELFDHLLSGLSVQVLIRCRIVCKVWLRIIDCLYPWMKDINPGKTCIFGCSADDEITGPRIYGMIKKGDEMIPEQIASFPELRGFRHGISGKVTTSNGLILLERQDKSRILESAVINPLTKEMVVVPGSPYQPVAFDNLTLGYDPLSGSHKLVQQLVRDENNNLGAAIYNLRGRSWRFIPFPGSLLASSHGAFENRDQERRGGLCISDSLLDLTWADTNYYGLL